MLAEITKLEGARKVICTCANIQPTEKVLIMTDTETARVGELIAVASRQIANDTVLIVIPARDGHGEEPPQRIVEALKNSDVLVLPLKFSMTHTGAIAAARACGTRVVSMGDFNESMLQKGGLQADFPALEKVVRRVAELLDSGKKLEVTTEAGSHITMQIDGRKGSAESGMAIERGSIAAPPDIEANVSPIEGSTEGRLVIDGSVPHPWLGIIQGRIEIEIRKGNIVEISGSREANTLKEVLDGIGDVNIFSIAEFGIGINPRSVICGRMLEDEGAYRTCHVGIGDNTSYGGTVRAKGHIDLIFREPTIVIDGRMIEKKGEIVS